MNLKLLALSGVVLLACGCERKVVVEKEHRHESDSATESPPTPAAAPAPVAAAAPDAPPQYYEEGSTYNGTVVVEPSDVSDYVSVNGGWYFWHPNLNIWVRANHPSDWHPPQNVRVYHNWNEHPMSRRGR